MNLVGKIVSTIDETPDVKTFRINVKFPFIAGQYCLVSIPGNEELSGQKRPFTFSNSPTEPYVELTIKKMGVFTTAMHSLRVGAELEIEGPHGQALNFDESIQEDVVFIAGGSGITPFMSAIRYAIAKKLPNKIFLLFSNNTEKDIIYRAELQSMPANIKVINTLTRDAPADWTGERGYISKALIGKYIPDVEAKLWYICGPPAMMKDVKELLLSMGISDSMIRIEPWQI
jgi:NAD(P)H-flavin reductase